MNQSELKEAMDLASAVNFIDSTNKTEAGFKVWKVKVDVLETLLDLAQQYLDIKGFPEEKKCEYCGYPEDCRCETFNEALHLAKLAWMKKLEGMEEALNKIMDKQGVELRVWKQEYFGKVSEEKLVKNLAQELRQHMGGK